MGTFLLLSINWTCLMLFAGIVFVAMGIIVMLLSFFLASIIHSVHNEEPEGYVYDPVMDDDDEVEED